MKVNSESQNKSASRLPGEIWKLKLYVVNRTLNSVAALTNLKRICSEHLEGKCSIALIDIEKRPDLAKQMQIVAVPTLVKTFPLPMRRIIGNLSNTERVLKGLHIGLTVSALPSIFKGK